ncbi:hypothetical protein ACH40E_18125 [Streptomyces acidicola]
MPDFLSAKVFRHPAAAWQLSEQIIGCLLAMVVDAMSGMITQCARHGEMS